MAPALRRPLPWILILLVGLAAAVRLGRLPIAWNYWAMDYLGYALPHRDELAHGHLAWTRATGLHPGLWSLVLAGIDALGGGVRASWAASLLCSLGSIAVAIGWLGRWGLVPAATVGLLLALSPLQAHYGLELNNYPLYLLAASLLAVGTERALLDRGVGLAWLGATLALHTHLAAHALLAAVALLALIWRRPRLLLALAGAELVAAPVTLALWGARGAAGTFHNERLRSWELLHELSTLWARRFSPPWALALLTAGVLLLGLRALRSPARREASWTLAALLMAGTAATWIGLRSGAAFVAQTPYWLQPSWAALTLASLGTAGLSGSRLVGLALALGVWAIPAADRALHPTAGLAPRSGVIEPPSWRTLPLDSPRPLTPPDAGPGREQAAPGFPSELTNAEPGVPDSWWRAALIPGREGPRVRPLPAPDGAALRAWLDRERPDVLLWIWEPSFLNDDPRGWDPTFAALSPGDLGDFVSVEAPWPPTCRRWLQQGVACFLNHASLRGGEFEGRLRAALLGWHREGRDVALVFSRLDPGQVPPDPRRVRRALGEAGGTWTDAFVGVTWVARVR